MRGGGGGGRDALEYELAGLCMRKALTVPLNPTTLYVKYAFVPIPFRCNNYLSLAMHCPDN